MTPNPPTQLATTVPHQANGPYTNPPAEWNPVAQVAIEKNTIARGTDKKVKIWSIGKWQIVAMIVGIILFVGTSYIVETSIYTGNVALNIETLPLEILLETLPLITILFFGVVFGPWVGLFTGGISILVLFFLFPFLEYENYGSYSLYFGYFFKYFTISDGQYTSFIVLKGVGFALIGFIAGLSLLVTKGRYNSFRSISITVGISILATLFGFGLAFTYGQQSYNGYFSFVDFLFPVSTSLIPLPILLVIYNLIVRGLKQA